MMFELRENFRFAYNGDFRSLSAQLTVFQFQLQQKEWVLSSLLGRR